MTNRIYRLLISLLILFSQTSLAAVDRQMLNELDLKRALFANQYTNITVDDAEKLVLLSENTTAIVRGVAILVADSGITPTSKQSLAPLSAQLNQLGWVTLMLPVPATDFFANPSAKNTAAQAPISAKESASEFSMLSYEQHLASFTQLMTAALKKATEFPGFMLVIAQGTSAASLSQLFAEQKLKAPDAFVVIGPYWPERQINLQLANALAKTTMPVLDLYSDWDNNWSLASISARKIAAIRSLKMQYRQREIIGVNLPHQPSSYITKEIYGWLTKMGW